MKVLLSIKPEFVQEIIAGRKKYEYRKRIFKRNDVSSIIVYATKPYGKVVGEFQIEKVIKDRPSKIWKKTKKHSGISQELFNKYFDGSETGFAIQIKNFTEYEVPLDLTNLDENITVAPQSFRYIEGE